jgi:AhpD family alkylhydroperoxidase
MPLYRTCFRRQKKIRTFNFLSKKLRTCQSINSIGLTRAKELIAIGAAHTTQCPYCIESQVKAAKKAGATDQEIAEAIFVAAALRAGGAFAHSTISMAVLKEMETSEKGK